MIQLNEQVLDEKLSALEAARAWSPRVISKLETMIRTADDYDLFRVNAIQYAAEKNLSENEAIDLFLHSTKIGLFEMDWHLVCGACGHVVESLRELKHLHPTFTCNNCYAAQTASFDDYIQVTFTISPLVRDIAFHHPESLPVEDLYLKYHMSRGVLPLPDGRTYEEFGRDTTRLLTSLMPGEVKQAEFEALPGLLMVSNLSHSTGVAFMVAPEQSETPQPISIHLANSKFQLLNHPSAPQNAQFGPVTFELPQAAFIQSGTLTVSIKNTMAEPSSTWICNFRAGEGPYLLQFAPFLSGKRLLTNQTFRTLFRSESVGEDEGIGVKDITFLFTDLKGSTAMYDTIGDPKAYYLVRQHFDTLGKVVAQHSGAIVKTIGDAIMATFLNPVDAIGAALDMIRDLDEFNRSISENLYLKVGIHTGHSIAVTLNERLDYFGQTVNIAARVQGLADGDEIYITHDAYIYPGVSEILSEHLVAPEQVAVKGVTDHLQVYKITAK